MTEPLDAAPALTLDPEAFERLVVAELDLLPDDMVDGLDNVVFVVEDRPEDGGLDLLGLYDGWSLPDRDRYGSAGELPDRIILYREPHLAVCADEAELRDEIHTTLVHEIAHFYGIDDARLHEFGLGVTTTGIAPDERIDEASAPAVEGPWQTVVWNDPVNLMSYVVHVFQEYFGYSPAVATRLMLSVHHDGHAVVARGPREQMELHVHAMQDYGLWATVRKEPT